MKRNTSLILLALLFCIVSTSFAQKFTATNLTLPFFTEKNQWQVGVLYHYQPEFHASYALSNHLRITGVVSHGSWYKGEELLIDNAGEVNGVKTFTSNRSSYDLSLGTFFTFKNNKAVFDLNGGITYGSGRNVFDWDYMEDSLDSRKVLPHYDKFFQAYLQPSIGFHGKVFGYGFGFKTSYLLIESGNISTFMLEPINKFSIGWQRFRFDMQIGLRLLTLSNARINYRYFHFGGGLTYRFAKRIE